MQCYHRYMYMRKCKAIKPVVCALYKKVAPTAAFIAQPLKQALADTFEPYKVTVTVSCLSSAIPVLVFV